tara:strand:+ start:4631 stop:5776 length:1146 start_codon:yes stop_codon:yes gene_type:complete
MSNKLILLFLIASTAFFSSFSVASEDQSIKKKLGIVKKNIFKEKQKKENLIMELDNINRSIKNTDTKINNVEKNIIKIKGNKKILNKEIQEIKIYIEDVKKRKKNSNIILKKIIYGDYSNKNINFIYKILNSESKDIFLDIEFSKYISKSHNNKLDLYEIDENIKNAMLKKYYKKIDMLNDQNNNLSVKLSELNRLEKKNILLSKNIEEKIKDSKEIYLKYISKESNLTELLNKFNIQNTSVGILKIKGTLPWPANGRVSRNFNNFKFKNLYKWNGEVISTSSSKSVRSIYSGKIVFSDWIKGYGLMLIIDHGEKVMSLYANNKVLLKKSGDYVKKGDEVAMSGSSGGNKGNSIYFEIRQNGIPQDPHEWCSIKNKFSLAQ